MVVSMRDILSGSKEMEERHEMGVGGDNSCHSPNGHRALNRPMCPTRQCLYTSSPLSHLASHPFHLHLDFSRLAPSPLDRLASPCPG